MAGALPVSERGAALPQRLARVVAHRVERVSCHSCVPRLAISGPDVHDGQLLHACSAKGCVVKSRWEVKVGLAFLYAAIRDGFGGQMETELPRPPITTQL